MVVRAKLQIITQIAKTNGHKSQASFHSSKKLAAGASFHAQLRPVLLFNLAIQAVSSLLFVWPFIIIGLVVTITGAHHECATSDPYHFEAHAVDLKFYFILWH